MVNVELLDRTMNKILEDQEHWSQNSWRRQLSPEPRTDLMDEVDGKEVLKVNCNTAFCFAGWAVQLGSKDRPLWADTERLWAVEGDDPEYLEDDMILAEYRAQRLLGLSYEDAQGLFEGTNGLGDLEERVEEIKENARVNV